MFNYIHLRKDVIYMHIVAIDIAKFHHDAIVVDDDTGAIVVEPFRFGNNDEGFKTLMQNIRPYLKGKHLIGFESTGHYGHNLMMFLLDHKLTVGIVNPLSTKAEREKKIRKTKTDRIDCYVIYKVLSSRDYARMSRKKLKLQEAKTLTRAYNNLMEDITLYKNRLQKCVDIAFPELNGLVTPYTKCYNAILKEFGSAKVVAKTHLGTIKKVLSIKGRGNHTKVDPHELKTLAQRSIGQNIDANNLEIEYLLGMIEFLEEKKKIYTKKIEEYARQLNSPIFSIPGIGYTTGLSILSEIGDIALFSSATKVVAFAGVDPSVYQSGEYQGNGLAISKRGSRYLRKALYQCILTVCNNSSTFKNYYNLKKSQGKTHLCAQGHCVRKLIRVIYKLLTQNIKFDETALV
jgi:transposase